MHVLRRKLFSGCPCFNYNVSRNYKSHRFNAIEGDTRHADQRHLLEPHGGLRLSRGQRGLQCLLLRRQVSPSVDFLPLDHA